MKRLVKITSLLCATIFLGAWSVRPAFNDVKSIQVLVNSSRNIGTYYTKVIPGYLTAKSVPGSSVQSLVLEGLSNKGYSHIMVVNNTGSSIALANVDEVNPYIVPSGNVNAGFDSASAQLYVSANSSAAWDDISVFDAIYVRSTGASITSLGNIDIMVW
jgi:hypothetical protein